jgi:hypothetical protein
MSYEGLVEAGREARHQADNLQWTEGDLALQVEALPADERPRDPETGEFVADEAKTLQRYANDIDIPYNTVRLYRHVAGAWPIDTRVSGVAWGAHHALASQDDRFALIHPTITVREAEKIVRDRAKGASGKPGWHELLGQVGQSLKIAEKHMTKFEGELEEAANRSRPKYPTEKLVNKGADYADWAEALAVRLRQIS